MNEFPFFSEEEENTRLAPSSIDDVSTKAEETKQSSYSSPQTHPFYSPLSSKTSERYHILETLGEGGMGIVQRVQDTVLGREVALKQIKWGELGQELTPKQQMMLWRLKAEASITAILEHPNIVPLYDLQRKETGEMYFTMRKIEGDTLKDILKQQFESEEINETYLLSIFLKVCDAVSYAHSKEVVHRDLKPDNIMVGPFGEVYVMDWGIAKILSKNVQEHVPSIALSETAQEDMFQELQTIGGIGTPGYMAPEQKSNAAQVTSQADIHALGKILKQCFTGQSPHEEFQYLLQFYQKQRPQKNSTLRKNKKKLPTNILEEKLSPDIKAIIHKATEESLTERYQTVQELSEDLIRYQQNIRVSARDYNFFEALQKWVKRNRQKIIRVLFILSCLIGYPAYFAYNRVKEREISFQEAFQNAQHEKENAQKVIHPGKIGADKKIEFLLNSLFYWNSALTLQTKHPEVEQYKLEVGKELLTLCYQTQDYQLARYVVRELQSLNILTLKEKKSFLKSVEDEQTQVLKKHQQQLDFWEKKFRAGEIEEGEREDAIFEIARMEEEEILKRLVQIAQEGNTYFLTNPNQTTILNSFYETFGTALGRIDHPKVEENLLAVLTEMAEAVSTQSEKWIRPTLLNYMVTLTYGLRYSTSPKTATTLTTLYKKMKNHHHFQTRTQPIYRKILQNCGEELFVLQGESEKDYLERGSLKQEQQDFVGAIQDYTEAIRLNPRSHRAFLRRGNIKQDLKDFEGAIQDFTQAIQISPDPAPYNNRGDIKRDTGDFAGAIEDYNQAISMIPDSSLIYHNRGMAHYYNHQDQEAFNDFTRAIQLDPNYSEPYNGRAVVQLEQNKFDEAIQDFNTYIRLRPELPITYNNRGIAKFRKKDFKGALEDFNETLRLDPQHLQAYEFRAKTKRSMGDDFGALQDYEHTLILYQKELLKTPNNLRFLLEMANTLSLLNRTEEAFTTLEKILSLHPDNPRGVESMANLLIYQIQQKYRTQEFEKALEKVQRFQHYIPKNHPQFQKVEQMQQQLQKKLQEKK